MTEKEFINKWAGTIQKTLRKFPQDFINGMLSQKTILPALNLVLGEELFGKIEITDSSGNSMFFVESMAEAKYYLYAVRSSTKEIEIPCDRNDMLKIIKLYEKELDEYLKEIENDYQLNFPGQKNQFQVSNEIFRTLNLIRY